MSTTDFEHTDLFRDRELPVDPYPFYEWVREHGPVWYYPLWDVWLITGYEEVIAIYHDQETWSNCNTVSGPFFKMSVPLEGDDITDIIEEHRDELPFSDQLPSFDPPEHTAHRGLLMRLITPKRLKENEVYMWQLADQTIDEFIDTGECELVQDYAIPFTRHGDRGPPRRARRGPRRVPGPPRAQGAPREDGAQAARLPVRPVHPLHRGPPRATRATTS